MLRAIVTAWFLTAVAQAQIVEGRVVNSVTGADIPDAQVAFDMGSPTPAYQAASDTHGRFRLEKVNAGSYRVRYQAPGFWPVPNRTLHDDPPAVDIASTGDPIQLELRLQPIPKISGHVWDDAGHPVPNAIVRMLANGGGCGVPSCFSFATETRTNEQGEYTIANFEMPGKWLITAEPPASLPPPPLSKDDPLGWAQTFYPGTADLQHAQLVVVQPGGDSWSLDIKLAVAPFHHVRGRVLDPQGHPAPKAAVILTNGLGSTFAKTTADDGAFDFDAVPDAEWRLLTCIDHAGAKWRADRLIKLQGQSIDDADLQLVAPFAIRGQVVIDPTEGVPPASMPVVFINSFAGDIRLPDNAASRAARPAVRPFEDGNFTFDNVYPGQYEITVFNAPPPPYYLESIRLGGLDAFARDVPIASGEQPLLITFKTGGGTVHGTVEGCGSSNVLLIPRDPALRRDQFIRVVTCDPNGGFQFEAVRPGEYYGIAVPVLPGIETVCDERFLRQAIAVSVQANQETPAEIRVVK